MKNFLIILLALTTLAGGGLTVYQSNRASEAERNVATLREEVEKLESRVAMQQKQSVSLQSRLQDTRGRLQSTHVEAATKSTEVAQLQKALTNLDAKAKENKNPLAEMFKDPDMKDMIKTQQKMAFGGIIDKSYASFMAQMQMTPEQSAAMKDMITRKMLVDAEMGMAMMGGELDDAKRKELLKQSKEQKDAVDAEIRQFLGDSNFASYQAYEKTLPDRMSIGMFKDQQASGAGAITSQQEELLVQAFTEERNRFKFTTDFNDQSKVMSGDMAANFTEEKIAQFSQELDQLQQLYVQRAQGILNEDQLAAFQNFVKGQRSMQEMGMKMAAKMFGGQKK